MTRDAETWDQLQALFHLAEATPEAERERVLAANCSDPDLQLRVMALLHGAHVEVPVEAARPGRGLYPSSKIGPYSILRHLGTGGLGSVYLAERLMGGVVNRSALKILAPHAAGPAFIARFHREQHILASLEHKNITRMLDVGLGDDGQPYLVMEFVDGAHLDEYCDQNRQSIPDRLKLFLQICEAVAYAHRNLIVHLDLKPSNILVTPEGMVKLLDFGTSKLIQPDSLLTTTIAATPAYASPEQLRNDAVTTACDVYALGAILFELLSGRRPNGDTSLAVLIERAMNELEPKGLDSAATPAAAVDRGLTEGQLRAMLSGDLANVVAKCLRARPENRYASVDALAADVQRYVGGRPVLARPQTKLYRLRKFVRRNRKAVAAVVLMNVVILASLGYGAWRQQQAVREGQRAERMQAFMYRLFKLANSNYTGKPAATVPEFLQLGVKMLPDYIRNPDDLLQAKIALAESMFDNGDLGDAKAIFEQTAATAHSMGNGDVEAESEAFAGHIAFSQGDAINGSRLTADALKLSQQPGVSAIVRVRAADYYAWNRDSLGFLSDEDLRLLRYAADQARRNNLPLHEKADAIHELGNILLFRGQLDEAQQLDEEVLTLLQQDPLSICDQSELYGELADVKELKLDFEGALPLWQRSYSGYSACSGADGREALSMLAYEARDLVFMGRAPEAVSLLEPSKPYWEKLPDRYGRWRIFAVSLANAYVATGRFKEAEDLAIAVAHAAENLSAQFDHGYVEYLWAASLAGQHKYDEALAHAENASRDWNDIPASVKLNPEDYRRLSDLQRLRAEIQPHLKPVGK